MLMESPESGLRVLLLALHGLEEATKVFDLNSEDVQREVAPLIALTYDIQTALKRKRECMGAAVDPRGVGEA
jgi:hypothetical protein